MQLEISAPVNTANRIFLNLTIITLPPPCVLYSTLEGEAERRAALDFSNMNAKTLHQPPWLPDLEFSGLGLLVSRCLRPASVTHRMLTWAANFAPYRARLADIGPIWARYRLIVTLALPTLLLLSKALNEIVCGRVLDIEICTHVVSSDLRLAGKSHHRRSVIDIDGLA